MTQALPTADDSIEALHPPAVELGRELPWVLFGLSLLLLLYFVGVDEGAASVRAGRHPARVGARRPAPARLPLSLGRAADPPDLRAARGPGRGRRQPPAWRRPSASPPSTAPSRYEEAQAAAAGEPPGDEVVSRDVQKGLGLLTATCIFGVALGGLFALAFAWAYGRVATASPARTAVWLAAAAFVVVYLVPFAKYPATPPAVGDPDTIGRRTALYLVMIAISVLAAVAAVRLRRTLVRALAPAVATLLAMRGVRRRRGRPRGWPCPASHEVPATFPRRRCGTSARRRSRPGLAVGHDRAGVRGGRAEGDDRPAALVARQRRRRAAGRTHGRRLTQRRRASAAAAA